MLEIPEFWEPSSKNRDALHSIFLEIDRDPLPLLLILEIRSSSLL